MRFYEFEAKQLLKKHRIPLVQSELAQTADEAEKIASDIGEPVVLKAQAIAPGLAASSVREASDAAGAKAMAESENIQKRVLEPEELGPMAALLAAEESAGITGQVVSVDGGYKV